MLWPNTVVLLLNPDPGSYVPPAPEAVHNHTKLQEEVEGEENKQIPVKPSLSLVGDTDILEPLSKFNDSKEQSHQNQLEADDWNPPPVEGECKVEARVVMVDGGHHGDLEHEEEDEESVEDADSLCDAGECGVLDPEQLQLQVALEHEDPHDLLADGQVGVQHIQQPTLVGLIPALSHVGNGMQSTVFKEGACNMHLHLFRVF